MYDSEQSEGSFTLLSVYFMFEPLSLFFLFPSSCLRQQCLIFNLYLSFSLSLSLFLSLYLYLSLFLSLSLPNTSCLNNCLSLSPYCSFCFSHSTYLSIYLPLSHSYPSPPLYLSISVYLPTHTHILSITLTATTCWGSHPGHDIHQPRRVSSNSLQCCSVKSKREERQKRKGEMKIETRRGHLILLVPTLCHLHCYILHCYLLFCFLSSFEIYQSSTACC